MFTSIPNLSSPLIIILVLCSWAPTPIHTRPTHSAKPEQGQNELFRKYHVHITHDLTLPTGDHPAVGIFCWSKDDDLPKKTLSYGQEYLIRFGLDLFRTTRFLCSLTWSPKELLFEAFLASRDESRCHKGTCYWAIRSDGVYFSRNNATWDREFQWRLPPPPTSVLRIGM